MQNQASLQETKQHGAVRFPFNLYPCTIPGDFPQVALHWQESMELVFVKRGTGLVQVGAESCPARMGDIFIFTPGTLHALRQAEGQCMEYENIIFELELLGGAEDRDNTEDIALPTIAQERQSADNKANDLESLRQQKKQLEVALEQKEVNKKRLILRAPEDGKILKVIAKEGEMVSANTPVILLESSRYYYDIYVNEVEKGQMKEGDRLTGHTVSGNREVPGTVRLIAQAPGFADFKMSREKSSADLTAFQIRTYIDPVPGVIPGMTVEVNRHEFTGR